MIFHQLLSHTIEQLEDRTLPAFIYVTTLGDISSPTVPLTTLREAIVASVNHSLTPDGQLGTGNDTIRFLPSFGGQSIDLTDFTNDATVPGPTALTIGNNDTLVIDGETGLTQGITIDRNSTSPFRLFDVNAGSSLTVMGLTLSGGTASGFTGGNAAGGLSAGLDPGRGATGGGSAGLGGAIFNQGTLTILNSTLSGNTAQGGAGGATPFGPVQAGSGGGAGLEAAGQPFQGNNGGAGGAPNGGTGGATAVNNSKGAGFGGAAGFGGGGGGGGYTQYFGGAGGPGGFGGGGGGSTGTATGGGGGFGGGGGGGSETFIQPLGGLGGFGGGNGGQGGAAGNYGGGGGGGGAGMGGAIFNEAGTVVITNSTLTGNTASGGAGGTSTSKSGAAGKGLGGGLFNHNGSITVNDSTFSGNTAAQGGRGIFTLGDSNTESGGTTVDLYSPLFVIPSTGSYTINVASTHGFPTSGTLAVQTTSGITQVSYTGMTAYSFTGCTGGSGTLPTGGSVRTSTTGPSSAAATINNSIIGQSDTNVSDLVVDVDGTGTAVLSGAANLIRSITVLNGATNGLTSTVITDPDLGTLQNNGGPTKTLALLSGSPAIDAGNNAHVPTGITTDQRVTGFSRIVDNTVDIGAFEYPGVATTVTVASSAASPTYGEAVTFTATISSNSTPAGTVDFVIDSGTPVAGVAGVTTATTAAWTYSTSTLSAGAHTIEAIFGGSGNFNNSSGTLSGGQTVNKAAATVVVTPYTVTYDSSPHTATVSAISGVNGESGAAVGTVDVSGTTHTNAGTYADTWSFTGSPNYFDIASTAISDVISKAPSSVVVTVASGPFTYTGLPQTPATVSVSGPGGLTLAPAAGYTGNVTPGVATASYVYPGDANHTGSSGSTTFIIAQAAASVAVSLSASPASLGQPITFTANVPSITGLGTPTGSITFLDGTMSLGSVTLIDGKATLTSTLGVGAHIITARYGGNPSYTVATSPSVTETVAASREGKGQIYAVGAGPGGGPRVEVFNAVTNSMSLNFFAFNSAQRGGVSVATGDVTGNGVEDVIAGAGYGGGPEVEVFNGQTGALIANWFAYDPSFRGGVWVAAEDLYGDGRSEIVTGPGMGGGPVVEVWSLATGVPTVVQSFLAYEPSFRGGVTVAAGIAANAKPDIIVGAGPGGGPRVRTFDAATLSLLSDVYAYAPSFTGGVYVASGDVLGTGTETQTLVGPGPSGGAQLVVLDSDGTAVVSTFAAVGTLRNGLTVAAVDQLSGPARVLIGAGQGAYEGSLTGGALGDLQPVGFFEDGFQGGVFVG